MASPTKCQTPQSEKWGFRRSDENCQFLAICFKFLKIKIRNHVVAKAKHGNIISTGCLSQEILTHLEI